MPPLSDCLKTIAEQVNRGAVCTFWGARLRSKYERTASAGLYDGIHS